MDSVEAIRMGQSWKNTDTLILGKAGTTNEGNREHGDGRRSGYFPSVSERRKGDLLRRRRGNDHECGTLHFRNKVFPKSSSAASSEGSNNDKGDDAGEEEDNPTNDVEDDANNNEEEDQEDTAPEEEEQSEDVPSNGWADLV